MFNEKRYSIVRMLLDNLGEEVSGEKMSSELGISRTAIAKHIKKLRTMGCSILAKPGGGYTMQKLPNIVCEELVRSYSRELMPVRIKETVKSTNIEAKEWAEEGAEHGSMIIARTQTEGRGRRQRVWQSVDGGIWSSIILKLNMSPSKIQPVTLAAAMAVSQAINQNCPEAQPKIKWPNDILINGKKVCGILTEFIGDIDELRYIIVGIGINNSFDASKLEGELLHSATTLQSENIMVNGSKLIANVRDNLLDITAKWCESDSNSHIIEYYSKHMAYKNEKIRLSGIGTETIGILKGIDDSGALIIDTDDGEQKHISGEISVRKV